MKLFQIVALSPLVALAVGCASTSSGIVDPTLEEEARQRDAMAEATEARLGAPERLLTDLDKAINNYYQFRSSGSSNRSESTAEKLHAFVQQQAIRNFDMLIHEADSIQYPRNRAIAVAALAFSNRPDALEPLVNAAQDDNPEVVANAIFGLGILADRRTPPAVVARVINDSSHSDQVRGGAAWTLYVLQQTVVDPAEILGIWTDLLTKPIDSLPSLVLISAIRGLGITRNGEYVDLVARFVPHPIPKVRQAVAIALGRLGSESAVPALLALLGPAESNENVRLAARKGLQALAGDADRKYDVEEWKAVFDRDS